MRSVTTIQKYLIRKLKNVEPESWVERPVDAHVSYPQKNLEHLNIQFYRDVKKELETSVPQDQIQPVSPKMGAYRI